VIHVDDDGAGIPAPDRERLFEPFVRLDGSRDRESGGFGLGLAIVRQVARWHGGEASITESPLGGARVTIAW
jgi:two-component system, OmpR family, sensor kinase ParS